MPNTQLKIRAVDALDQAQYINAFIQGFCARMDVAEMSADEAKGLWGILDGQNERLKKAAAVIETIE